jgi:hypothetical protein
VDKTLKTAMRFEDFLSGPLWYSLTKIREIFTEVPDDSLVKIKSPFCVIIESKANNNKK